MRLAVTTAIKPSEKMIEKAETIASDLSLQVIARKKKSISKLLLENELDYIFIVQKDKVSLKSEDNEIFWHPGTSVIKLWDAGHGKSNQLLKAVDLKEGDRVLDCTLGYGSDAITMASAVGDTGRVTGLEASRIMAYLTADGLKNYEQVSDDIRHFMQRIDVVNANYKDYLRLQPDDAFDVVYFDPMFQNPNFESKSMNALRDFAEMESLSRESIDEALRVCRKKVIVKERIGSGVFKALGITERIGEMRYGAVVYGIIRK